MTKKRLSQSVFAAMMDVSDATVSNFLNGKADTISGETMELIRNEVETRDLVSMATANYNRVLDVCREAQQRCRMLALVGLEGYGKSLALREYYVNTPKVYYMECLRGQKPREFFKRLLQKMGIRWEKGSVVGMIERISHELRKTSGSLIILDEAGKVSRDIYLHLHDLRNKTSNVAGIVLCGLDYFQHDLDRWKTQRKRGIPEFHSRIADWIVLAATTAKEKAAICAANGVRDKDTVVNICKASSNLRELSERIRDYLYNMEYSMEREGVEV